MKQETLEKFKKLYFDKFGIELTNEEATAMATDLVNLMEVLLKEDKSTKEIRVPLERSEYATVRT